MRRSTSSAASCDFVPQQLLPKWTPHVLQYAHTLAVSLQWICCTSKACKMVWSQRHSSQACCAAESDRVLAAAGCLQALTCSLPVLARTLF